jgi:hypothetical protein
LAAQGCEGQQAAVVYVLVLDQTLDDYEARGRLEFPVSNRNYQAPDRYAPVNFVEQLGLAQVYRALIKVRKTVVLVCACTIITTALVSGPIASCLATGFDRVTLSLPFHADW